MNSSTAWSLDFWFCWPTELFPSLKTIPWSTLREKQWECLQLARFLGNFLSTCYHGWNMCRNGSLVLTSNVWQKNGRKYGEISRIPRSRWQWRVLWVWSPIVVDNRYELWQSQGTVDHSFVSSGLEAANGKLDTDKWKEMIIQTASTICAGIVSFWTLGLSSASFELAAGADSTGAAIVVFILAMVLNPDVQTKAQAEIDQVLERRRLPEFSDQVFLPYVTAIMKEVLRYVHFWDRLIYSNALWHNDIHSTDGNRPIHRVSSSSLLISWLAITFRTAVPHLNTQDDNYLGYFIPANSIIIPNLW